MRLKINLFLLAALLLFIYACNNSSGSDSQPGTLKWKYRVGGNVGMDWNGKIYASNTEYLTIMTPDRAVEWKFRVNDSNNRSNPVIGKDGTVYLYGSDLSAISPDGKLKWKHEFDGLVSKPSIAHDGTIYILSHSYAEVNTHLTAFDSEGRVKWDRGDIEGVIVNSSNPALGKDGTIYVRSTDMFLYAFDSDGAFKWKYLTGGSSSFSLAIGSDGTVYTGEAQNFYALKPDGSLKWTIRITENDSIYTNIESVIDEDGTIYVTTGNGYVLALNPDGTLKWKTRINMNIRSCPAIGADGTIYVSANILGMDRGGAYSWASDGSLYALNPDGTLKWEYTLDTYVHFVSSPVIGDDGVIYIGASNGFVYAVFSESMGLATSSWPKGHANNQNSSAAAL
jgi:outer membrane protein assembly factor BamB